RRLQMLFAKAAFRNTEDRPVLNVRKERGLAATQTVLPEVAASVRERPIRLALPSQPASLVIARELVARRPFRLDSTPQVFGFLIHFDCSLSTVGLIRFCFSLAGASRLARR